MFQKLIHWWRKIRFCNPYSTWDTSLNPQYWVWEYYHEPVSSVSDEHLYLSGALRFLETHGVLVTDNAEIKDKTKQEEDYLDKFYPEQGSKRFWYKHNLVSATVHDDDTYMLEFYRAASQRSVHEEFAQWVVEHKGDSKVSILIRKNGSLVANKVSFKPPVIDDLELNYGSGFGKVHEKIVEKMKEKKAGLYLLHGPAGTGKSNYIKYLTSIIDREALWIPVGMSDKLSDPDFISLLMDKRECILIFEDAEQAVQSRDSIHDSSSVSTLLNLSDGILGNIINASLILSYNSDTSTIDPALLRPGRLSVDYTFEALNMEDAKRLCAHLGKDTQVVGPMTLAEIYNADAKTEYVPPVKRKIGFVQT